MNNKEKPMDGQYANDLFYIDYETQDNSDIKYSLLPVRIETRRLSISLLSDLTFVCKILDLNLGRTFATVWYTIRHYNDGIKHTKFDDVQRSIDIDYVSYKSMLHGSYLYDENTGMPKESDVFKLLKKFADAKGILILDTMVGCE